MTAWTIDDFGNPEVFEKRERPVPEIDPSLDALADVVFADRPTPSSVPDR